MQLRKWFTLLFLFVLCVPSTSGSIHAQSTPNISIYLDGKKVSSDVAPYIMPKQNVTMVPLRVISEGLGADVMWAQNSQTATITAAETTIKMTTHQKRALVNGTNVPLDASVQNKQGRIMVPLRFVSERLGLQVSWDQASRTIALQSNSSQPSDITDLIPPPDIIGNPASTSLKGVWVSSVYNLDWPSSGSVGNRDKQQQEYVQLLQELKGMGINAVFLQVRPSADAIYPSSSVPWSKYLTGKQGQDPGYDPLAFMIEETHKQGMQFHAWFNPFRANPDAKTDQLAPTHVAKKHPEWIVSAKNKLYINPGIPAARQQIISEIMEVVNLYDIDGVHLDDYFYPSDGVFPDDATFLANNRGTFATKAEWRRDNINQFVKSLGESIHNSKPEVEFGISPFGVWRNKSVDQTGSDTKAGVTAYDHMHADVRTWIQQGWIDYVTPQIYWSLSFTPAQYDKLVSWWANEVKNTNVKLYIGHSPYKLGTKEAGWHSSQEIINQLQYNTLFAEVQGDIFFSAKDLRKNPLGIKEALSNYYVK